MESGHSRSRSYCYSYSHSGAHGSYGYSSSNNMQLQPYYYGGVSTGPPHDLWSYSASYAQTQMGNPYNNPGEGNKGMKLKKGKSALGFGMKSWSFGDREFQRKKRIASYRMYGVEGKVKGSFRNSLRWIKNRCSQVVYGW